MGGDNGWSGGDRLQHHGRSDRTAVIARTIYGVTDPPCG